MRLVARIVSADGTPLAEGKAEIVFPKGDEVSAVMDGVVTEGELVMELPDYTGPVWGLRIDGRPVVTFPVRVMEDTVELGEIALLPSGVQWPAFHAPEGVVYGLPRTAPRGTTALPVEEVPMTRATMSFGDLFGSTAKQLSNLVAETETGLTLTSANVTLRGVPTSAQDAVALEFPAPALAATATGLSELSFTLRPRTQSGGVAPTLTGPRVPDLAGYTRELALRKLAAAGFVAEVGFEIARDPAVVGRVVRQLPAAGLVRAAGEVVRIFVGKNEEE